jgi:ATP-dependent Lhr-like helicase
MMLELGRERSPGGAGDTLLAEAEADLIAEALA